LVADRAPASARTSKVTTVPSALQSVASTEPAASSSSNSRASVPLLRPPMNAFHPPDCWAVVSRFSTSSVSFAFLTWLDRSTELIVTYWLIRA
jgi:hypothetical protein